MSKSSLLAELKRRKVTRAAVLYACAAWAPAQLAGRSLPCSMDQLIGFRIGQRHNPETRTHAS